MESIWAQNTSLPSFPQLKNDLKTDVLIIGGGMAGILCAYMLHRAGVSYALIEADKICHGVTRNTTAKITSQHGLIYHKLIRRFGADKARMYLEANEKAVTSFRALCQGIDCGFEDKDAYVYSRSDLYKLEKELRALDSLGYKADFVQNLPLPVSATGAVKFRNQAQFDPLQFISHISGNLNIYEHTPCRAFAGNTVLTKKAKIRAKKIIVCTHFPILNKHGSYYLKMYQSRSYVLALEGAQDVGGMYLDDDEKGLSFRNFGNSLLLGGVSHRTGKQSSGWDELSQFAKIHYPNANETCRWATQDCMTLDGIPYIGQYSMLTPDLYVATGFNKWGMTSSMVAATLLCDMVQEKQNKYAVIFSPSRSILRPQLAVNGFEAIVNLLTPTAPRCPHMGCALKWNKQERSWDCPCHGSRFTEKGRLLDNPSTADLKKAPRAHE